MIIKDFMTRNPFCVNPKDSVSEIRKIMEREHVEKLPVLDDSGAVIGIVTKFELRSAMPSEATTLDIYEISYLLSKMTVKSIMRKNPVFVQENTPIEEAAKIMAEKKISSLLVMKGGALSGIFTKSDLFRAVVDMFGAKYDGVRATVEVDDKCGELAEISQAIADENGKIVSVITSEGGDVSRRTITLKIIGMKKSDVESIMKKIDAEIKDLR